jgi:hypothetical protein
MVVVRWCGGRRLGAGVMMRGLDAGAVVKGGRRLDAGVVMRGGVGSVLVWWCGVV